MDTSHETRMNITEDSLPSTFVNIIVKNGDKVIIRTNVKTMEDIHKWVQSFEMLTNTKWNCRESRPAGTHFVCRKKYICQHSSFKKVSHSSKSADCQASVSIKINLNTVNTRARNHFIKSGLVGVVTIIPFHQHSLITAETLRFLPSEPCREKFEDYFKEGMGATRAKRHHEKNLKMNPELKEYDLANSRINPTLRTVSYWYRRWRLRNPGVQNKDGRSYRRKVTKSDVVIGSEPDSESRLEPKIQMTTVTPSDLVIEMGSTTLNTPDTELELKSDAMTTPLNSLDTAVTLNPTIIKLGKNPPELSAPGPSSVLEKDTSMTGKDIFLTLVSVISSDMVVNMVVPSALTVTAPGHSTRMEPDMMQQNVQMAMTCEKYPETSAFRKIAPKPSTPMEPNLMEQNLNVQIAMTCENYPEPSALTKIAPRPSPRIEPDMMEQDVHMAMTCENYPAYDPQPIILTKIKEEPIDTEEHKQDILSAAVVQEQSCVSKRSFVNNSCLVQPPVSIKEKPVSSEEGL